ncbi:MAG: ABC transporter permease [Planctomycetes bacterium]|nr:ABC transporter permease [Planctomycetota bacterium]
MTAYLLRRLLAAIPLLVAVSLVVFVLTRSVPGDPVDAMLGEKATPQVREEIRRKHGLDRPILVQYAIYMKGLLLRGDLGVSYVRKNQPIAEEIRRRLPATIELTLAAMILSILGGVLFGVLAAVKKGSFWDYASMLAALIGVSVPVFWLGLLLMLAFGGAFASGGNLDPSFDIERPTGFALVDTLVAGEPRMFLDALRRLVLPALALATIPMAMIARITRSSMLEVLGSDYVRTARAKGLDSEAVVMRHALRNALVPIVTLVGLEFGYLLGGAVLTETVFDWPGMGTYIMSSVSNRDYLAIQGAVMMLCLVFVAVNLLVDVIYAFVDPRIRYGPA